MEQFPAREEEEVTETEISRDGRPVVPSSGCEDPLRYEDPVMQISGAGHWFLEGWIGDHSVEFLVDSGSSVTAMSDNFYRNRVCAGAPLGALQVTARTLRSANGTGIEVMGCSRCSVSFLGLRTEFPIIICSLAMGTDAIIGTDVSGSVLPHTLDIKNGLLFAQGGASLQLHRKDSALSGRVFTVGHLSIPPYSEAVLHCSVRTTGGRALPSSGLLEGLTLFAEDTGLIVGRTLVDPSGWKVPVLVSNFGQETVVVNPFTEVGMITQVTAIQSVVDDGIRHQGVAGELPYHLQDLVDQTSGDLDGGQRRRLVVPPVVMPRRVTPANRPLQHLEAGRLGASTPQHVRSRPAVPDLCIASSNLLSVMDPLPMDRLSRHTVAEIRLWPAADRHDILAVANRDVRVARQNLAELQLYVDDHAEHLANCASADDDSLTLMSAELLPPSGGGDPSSYGRGGHLMNC